jgi:hypothetical protein
MEELLHLQQHGVNGSTLIKITVAELVQAEKVRLGPEVLVLCCHSNFSGFNDIEGLVHRRVCRGCTIWRGEFGRECQLFPSTQSPKDGKRYYPFTLDHWSDVPQDVPASRIA